MQGAGGVGGLLMVNAGTNGVHFPAYDLNGNVMGLVNAANGNISAKYEYGPFGEVFCSVGDMAKVSPFQFSTKYTDSETDLVYYGYRYYSPALGRWLSRDPIEEQGGLNLYGFVNNDPVNKWDRLGLKCKEAIGKNGLPRIIFEISVYSGGGWSKGRVRDMLRSASPQTGYIYGIAIDYSANVYVLCECDPCKEYRKGVRVYHSEIDASIPESNPAAVPGIPKNLIQLTLGQALENYNPIRFKDQDAQDDYDEKLEELRRDAPLRPTDGQWKGGKSPCD
jgi:RHS repeat-associated protein